MYSISDYGRMISDKGRMEAYTEALRRCVRPGSVVVDIGAGTGIQTLLACRFGARRVYAIEPDDIVAVAREVVAANDCVDRVEFFQKPSEKVILPERADVVVSDLRGVLPLLGRHIPAIVDARKRFLAPEGSLIPQRDALWASVVAAPELYSRHVAPAGLDGFDFDFAPAHRRAANTLFRARVTPEQFLVEPRCWFSLEYASIESPDVSGELNWGTTRPGTAHGALVWFDSELTDGVRLSNSPSSPELIYGSMFFPFSRPLSLAGDVEIHLSIRADLVGEDYHWRWQTRVRKAGADQPSVELSQSTFYGIPFSPENLRKLSAASIPKLNDDGKIDLFILDRLHRRRPLGEIAAGLAKKFPKQFSSVQDALTRVGALAQRFGR